jgi:DUF4097 and DUF4098 domain-containing protein YvlB
MRFKEILLVLVLLAAGFAVYEFETGRWDLTFDGDVGFFELGREYAFEENQTFEGPLPDRLEIANVHGWVEVRGADQENVQLTFKKRIRRRDEEAARDVAERLHYKLERAADRWILSTNRSEFKRRTFDTGFVLTVPRRLALTVSNSYGPVTLENLGEVTVGNRHGRVTVSKISGPAMLETTYEDVLAVEIRGDTRITDSHADVRVSSIAGGLRVESRYGDLRLEDIEGKVDVVAGHTGVDVRRARGLTSVETSYDRVSLTDVGGAVVRAHHSPVLADGVRGDLDVHTTYEPVKATGVEGNLIVNGHNVAVTAAGVGGREITISSSYENIDISDFSAKLDLTLRNGHIVLKPSALDYAMTVRDEYGTIDFYWPTEASAPLQARSKGGSIKWGLSEKPAVEKSNGESFLEAFVEASGRPSISLATTYGDIRIEPGTKSF